MTNTCRDNKIIAIIVRRRRQTHESVELFVNVLHFGYIYLIGIVMAGKVQTLLKVLLPFISFIDTRPASMI